MRSTIASGVLDGPDHLFLASLENIVPKLTLPEIIAALSVVAPQSFAERQIESEKSSGPELISCQRSRRRPIDVAIQDGLDDKVHAAIERNARTNIASWFWSRT